MITEYFFALALLSIFISFVYLAGKALGRHEQKELWMGQMDKGNRYIHAVNDLNVWCGKVSPHARLISQYLKDTGEGLNYDDSSIIELCEQLERLDSRKQRPTPDRRGTSQSAPVPLTDEQIADFVGEEYHNMTSAELRWFRLGETAGSLARKDCGNVSFESCGHCRKNCQR